MSDVVIVKLPPKSGRGFSGKVLTDERVQAALSLQPGEGVFLADYSKSKNSLGSNQTWMNIRLFKMKVPLKVIARNYVMYLVRNDEAPRCAEPAATCTDAVSKGVA